LSSVFGPGYFSKIQKYGVGLGMNPADAHDDYVSAFPDLVNYIEVLAPSSRGSGHPESYADIRRINSLSNGAHHWKIDEYPSHVKRILHSTNVNPVYPDPVSPEDYAQLRRYVELVDSPWVTEDLGIWLMSERHVYPFLLPLPLCKDTLAVAIQNINRFHGEVGVPFNAEFPPVTVVAGDMNAFDYFRILVEETGCGMALDIGHVLSYQIARGASPTADLHLIPWDFVTEVHLAGGNIDLRSDGYHYEDSHGDYEIITVCKDMTDTVIHLAPNLKAITIEIFGSKSRGHSLGMVRDIAQRESVRHWLRDEVPTFQLPTFEEAEPRVRSAAIGMHDILHNERAVSGDTLVDAGPDFVSAFASDQQRRWDYQRQARVQLQGLVVSSYFPLTLKWLLRSGCYEDELAFYSVLLKRLPGHSQPTLEKVSAVFLQIVSEWPDDHALREIYRFEEWMNNCVHDRGSPAIQTFSVDVVGLAGKLNSESEFDEAPPRKVTLAYTGNGRFGVVGGLEVTTAPVSCSEPFERGKNECCTGA
jgi:uncharacterized protein (UPF0276 family)